MPPRTYRPGDRKPAASVGFSTEMPEDPQPATSFGPNAWLVDEMYDQYRQDPTSVSASWREFFADYRPGGLAGRPAGDGHPEGAARATSPAAPAAGGAPAA